MTPFFARLPEWLCSPVAAPVLGEAADRLEVGEVEPAHLDVPLDAGGLALGDVADGEDHVRARGRQRAGGGQAEAAVRPGDDGGAPGLVGQGTGHSPTV